MGAKMISCLQERIIKECIMSVNAGDRFRKRLTMKDIENAVQIRVQMVMVKKFEKIQVILVIC